MIKTSTDIPINLLSSEENCSEDSEKSYGEVLIKHYERYIETLQTMKGEEKESGLSNGRRRWFNKEIEDHKEKIKKLRNGEDLENI